MGCYKHAPPASSTIPTQDSLADGDGYNPEFPFLEGFALSRQMVSFDDSSSEEASSASGVYQREVFVLPSGSNNSPGNKAEDAPRRSHPMTARGNDEDASSDEQSQHSDERAGNSRDHHTPLKQGQRSGMDDSETVRRKRVTTQRKLPRRAQYQSEEAQELQHINDLLENPSRELARPSGYDLFTEEIAQRLRNTMSKLERPHRHHSGSRGSTTPSTSSRSNNSPHGDRRKVHRSPIRKRVPRTSEEHKAPRRGDLSPL